MTFTFDPSGDLEFVADGLEALSYEPRNGTPQTIAHALRRAVTQREAEASNGLALLSDVKFRLPKTALDGEPALGDVLIDAQGERWTILAVMSGVLGVCWACTTRRLALAAGLDQTVTIEQALFAKGDGGAAEPTWSDYTTLQARLQPVAVRIADEHEQSVARSAFRVILEHSLDWTPDRRWRVRSGETTYAVVGYERPERIDALPALLVERSPWPLS